MLQLIICITLHTKLIILNLKIGLNFSLVFDSQAYTSLGDIDAVKGCGSYHLLDVDSHVEYYRQTSQWQKVLEEQDLQLSNSGRTHIHSGIILRFEFLSFPDNLSPCSISLPLLRLRQKIRRLDSCIYFQCLCDVRSSVAVWMCINLFGKDFSP